MIVGENIEGQDQSIFNALQGDYEAYTKWKLKSFVEFWKFLAKSNVYIETMNTKKDKKPELTPDFWETVR